MASIKLDMHVHTIYSGDSLIGLDDLIRISLKKGLNGFVISDHSTLKGYKILKKKAEKKGLITIPGMELETNIGEVIALFVEENIDTRDNDFFTIVEKIKQNNGLVVVPHPFDFLRPSHLKMNLLNDKVIKKHLNGIEIMNSRIIFKSCIKKARKFNEDYNLFETGGSDAHTPKEIGKGFTLIQDIDDLSYKGIYDSLVSKKSKSCGRRSSPLVHARTVFNKLQKGLYF